MVLLRGVLFDVDGTLVDSNDAHAWAWVEALRESGHDVPFGKVRPLIGMGGDKVLPRLVGLSPDEDRGKEIDERRKAIFRERHLPLVRPFPGARELVERVRDQGLAAGVATSSDEETKTALLRAAGVEDLFDAVTSADDAEESKPDPDIVEAALRRLRLPAGEAVMIGDTPYDVEAAARSGLVTIAVRCGGWDDAGLSGAVEIYDGPWDLVAHFEASRLGGQGLSAR